MRFLFKFGAQTGSVVVCVLVLVELEPRLIVSGRPAVANKAARTPPVVIGLGWLEKQATQYCKRWQDNNSFGAQKVEEEVTLGAASASQAESHNERVAQYDRSIDRSIHRER